MNWIKKLITRKSTNQPQDSVVNQPVTNSQSIPKGWYVAESGQNPLHMLWFVVLVNFDDVANGVENPRHFVEDECESFEQALKECIKKCSQ